MFFLFFVINGEWNGCYLRSGSSSKKNKTTMTEKNLIKVMQNNAAIFDKQCWSEKRKEREREKIKKERKKERERERKKERNRENE